MTMTMFSMISLHPNLRPSHPTCTALNSFSLFNIQMLCRFPHLFNPFITLFLPSLLHTQGQLDNSAEIAFLWGCHEPYEQKKCHAKVQQFLGLLPSQINLFLCHNFLLFTTTSYLPPLHSPLFLLLPLPCPTYTVM